MADSDWLRVPLFRVGLLLIRNRLGSPTFPRRLPHHQRRLHFRVGVQFLCSYITLPLYALVSQMGSSMKKSIFNDQTSKVLKKWHKAAKKRHQKGLSRSTSQSPSLSPLSTPNASAIHPLGRFRSRGPSDRSSSSPRRSYSDIEISDAEVDMQKFRPTVEPPPIEHDLPVELQHVDGGFSFARPPPIRTRQNL